MPRLGSTLALCLLVGVLAGCGGATIGVPQAVTGVSLSSAPPPSGTVNHPLADRDACSILTEDDVRGLDIRGRPVETKREARRYCVYSQTTLAVSVGYYDDAGIHDIIAPDTVPIPDVGRHRAVRTILGLTCEITMEMTPTSAVSATGTTDTREESCALAMRVAVVVEAKLP